MEILFDNPFIFVILVAVLSSLFKKKKGTAESQKRTNHPMENRRKQSSSPFDEVKEIFKEVSRSLQEGTNIPDRHEGNLSFEERQEIKPDQQQASKDQYAKKTITETPPILSMAQEQTGGKGRLAVDNDKLVEAVIWSEILGPPRAKKSYMKTRSRS